MASSISVEPASEDDWELVEIHAGFMEEQMLNQVSGSGSIHKEQRFTCVS